MHDAAQAKIFLSSERGLTETDWFRSCNSFCFGNYRDPDKSPFGPLYVLNDDTLAGDRQLSLQVEESTDLLLLPVVGAIGCMANGAETIVQAGQISCIALDEGATVTLFNPYEKDLVNFLQIWIRRPEGISGEQRLTDFNLDKNKNELIEVVQNSEYHVLIAKVGGRGELMHTPAQPGSGLFVFVIEGAFEVQNRLLEARDGLSLLNVEILEAEALSNDAILLLIELAPF